MNNHINNDNINNNVNNNDNECIIKSTFIINDIDNNVRILGGKGLLGNEFNEFNSDNCDIYIDNELIPFAKEYKSERKGKLS